MNLPLTFAGHKIHCDFSLGEAIGQLLIWIILLLITFGLAAFVLPYYFLKAPINRSYLVDASGVTIGRLYTNIGLGSILLHAFVWALLTLITFGLAYFLYWPAVMKRLLNAVEIQ